MLERVAFGVERQHFLRKGKEILGVEAQRHDHQNRGDQKHKDCTGNDAEGVVPKHLPCGQIWRKLLTVAAFKRPEGEPAKEPAEQPADNAPGQAANCKAGNHAKNHQTPARRFLVRHCLCDEESDQSSNQSAEKDTQKARPLCRADKQPCECSGCRRNRHVEGRGRSFDNGKGRHDQPPSFTLSMPTIRS